MLTEVVSAEEDSRTEDEFECGDEPAVFLSTLRKPEGIEHLRSQLKEG